MAHSLRARRLIPLALGVAMLAVVVAAGLAPNTGVVQAQTNSPYSQPASSGVSPYLYLGAALIVIAAIVLAILLLMRRRRPPPTTAAPVQAWQEGPAGGPAAPAPPPPPEAAPAYLETPEDVGHAPPVVPVGAGAAGATGGAVAAGTAGQPEPDIDSLMAELDKISGDILKRQPKKGAPTSGESTEEPTNP